MTCYTQAGQAGGVICGVLGGDGVGGQVGVEMTEIERKVMQTYQLLKELSGDAEAAPCVRANAQKALACVWQIVNDLGLAYEQLFDYGV